MSEKTIRELALSAAQGSAPAFQELYHATRQGAWYVALSIAKNEHDAQDILQESYLKAYQSMGQLARPESFVPWLNQIVANKAKNYISKKRPDSFAEFGDENAQDWQEETDPSFIPDERLDQEEAKALIASLVEELPEDQRLVVLLRYYDDMEVAAIAEALAIPEGTVKSRLGRARTKLAAMLQQAQGKGLRLYAMAPIPLLAHFIKLLGFDAPGSDRLPPLLLGTAAAGTAAAGGAAAAKTAAAAPKKASAGKVAAIAAAVAVAVGGFTAAGVYAYHNKIINDSLTTTTLADETAALPGSQARPSLFPTVPLPGSQESSAAQPQDPPATQPSGADKTSNTTVPSTGSTAQSSSAATTATDAATETTTRAPWTFPSFPTFTTTTRRTTTRRTTARTTTTTTTTSTEPPAPASDFDYRVEADGFLTITGYNGTQTSIVIPAQIGGKTVHHLEVSAFEGLPLTQVVISSGIDCIRARTFANCPDLVEVVVPASVITMNQANSFEDSPGVELVCAENSRAHTYAQDNGITFRLA